MICNITFRILLLIDNSPTHPSAEELNGIDPNGRVMYLPPNVTSLVQPMDQGVISALKHRYKMGFLYEMLSRNHKTNAEFVQSIKRWTILNCISIDGDCLQSSNSNDIEEDEEVETNTNASRTKESIVNMA